ncbi:MAG: hypothetical protein ABI597_00365 [Gammaproteobacteria bacterium]
MQRQDPKKQQTEFNKKQQDDLLQFNELSSLIHERVELRIEKQEIIAEEIEEEELEVEAEQQQIMRKEHADEARAAQQQPVKNPQTVVSPEKLFCFGSSMSSLEFFSSAFKSFAAGLMHLYSSTELNCEMNSNQSQVSLRFPHAHVAKSYLDFVAKLFPGLSLFMLPGNKKTPLDEEEYNRSTFGDRFLNPFRIDLTRI